MSSLIRNIKRDFLIQVGSELHQSSTQQTSGQEDAGSKVPSKTKQSKEKTKKKPKEKEIMVRHAVLLAYPPWGGVKSGLK